MTTSNATTTTMTTSTKQVIEEKQRGDTINWPQYALSVLYFSTNGPRWSDSHTDWLTTLSLDYCKWYGITCNYHAKEERLSQQQFSGDGSGNVIELRLESNSLKGTVPTELFLLTRLETIELYSNWLSGTVPSEIGNLVPLRRLNLGSNGLTGTIPSEISRLTALEFFNVAVNSIAQGSSMTVDRGLLGLTKLTFLSLEGMKPSEEGSMEMIPTEIGRLTNLKYLELEDGVFVGSIPTEIGLLTKLLTLQLRGNFLEGNIPTQIGQLSMLTIFDVSLNQLSGSLPSEIGQLTNLQSLNVRENYRINGSVPLEMSMLSNITYLDLKNTFLVGDLIKFCGNVRNSALVTVCVNTYGEHYIKCPCIVGCT
eukprot:CAMPEP_0202452320 /NCGR_PEP_ID=MMETSP1360-20130828/10558_1 /ASSEMBLY_ACC=CAM_ASM_000848 /TAXON_ID=515479 /ORGANISM="Licmophora paradoxa, Strain CCMP2313" /LENGTH=366 /DNA_ID=CAMNT_0049071107 /DNA_START=455 /DNA_END=1555 /DNA_ORIENTATION=+